MGETEGQSKKEDSRRHPTKETTNEKKSAGGEEEERSSHQTALLVLTRGRFRNMTYAEAYKSLMEEDLSCEWRYVEFLRGLGNNGHLSPELSTFLWYCDGEEMREKKDHEREGRDVTSTEDV